MAGRVNVLTHLMFQDGRAREAADWYVSLVPGSSIERVTDNGAGRATVYFTLADRYGVSWQIGTADRDLAGS